MGFLSNFYNRAGRVARGQADRGIAVIESATFEDTIKQTVRDMRTELNRMVKACADAMSNYNRLEAEYQKFVRQADEWKARTMKAVEAGNEDLAKKALAKKGECDERINSMRPGVETSHKTRDKLKAQVSDLKRKIEEAEHNASTLIARKNAAQAQKKIAEALAGVGEADNAFMALNSFEDSVAREEAAARAYDDMASSPDADLEAEFAKLDTSSVDSDLEALKREMGK